MDCSQRAANLLVIYFVLDKKNLHATFMDSPLIVFKLTGVATIIYGFKKSLSQRVDRKYLILMKISPFLFICEML